MNYRGPINEDGSRMYELDSSTTRTIKDKMVTCLTKEIRKNPNKKILVVFAIASHGMQDGGRQVVVLNDFNKKKGFFNTWQVEYNIRERAKKFNNLFQIAIFACCREHFRESYHCGLFLGTEEEATAHFEAIA